MTSPEAAAAPAVGFRLMLPRDWVTLDLDPDTAEESVRGVVDGMVHLDPGCAEGRAEVEELLSTMTREAIAARALLCGVRFGVDEQGRPVQALVSVTLRAVDGPTDPDGLFERFDDGTLDGRIATLDSGPALRVRSQTEAGFMSWGVFVPVPGADGVVAVVSLLSPSVHHEEQLDAFFDGLVESFRLTRDEDERQEEAQAR